MLIDPKVMRYASAISGAMFTMVLLVWAGLKLGGWLDAKLHTAPFLMALGFMTGAGLGFWFVIVTVEKKKPR